MCVCVRLLLRMAGRDTGEDYEHLHLLTGIDPNINTGHLLEVEFGMFPCLP